MSSFEVRRGRYFRSRSRSYDRSPSEMRGRFRGRSRDRSRSISRGKISRSERTRARDKFERRLSRDKLRSRSRERLRSRSRDRFIPNNSRGQESFDINERPQEQYGYEFRDNIPSQPVFERPDFHNIGGHPDYQHGEEYWRNQEQRPTFTNSRDNEPTGYFVPPPGPQIPGPIVEINNTADVPSDMLLPQQVQNFRQDKVTTSIPDFDPANPQLMALKWINDIEQLGNQKGWTPEEIKLHFASKLLGLAKDWFTSGKKILDPWTRVKRQFLLAFLSEMDFHKSLVAMVERKKTADETLSTYFNFKTVLMDKCSITGRKAVSCLIGGLSDSVSELKQEAFDINFETPEELYNFLKDKDVNGNVVTQEKPIKQSPKVCYVCKKPGHRGTTCRSKKRDSKNFKEVYINGAEMKAYFDVTSPKITLRMKDANRAKIHFRRQATLINISEHSKINTVGREEVVLKVDSVVVKVRIFIVPNSAQNTSVVLGTELLKYANLIETENGIHFTSIKSSNKNLEAAAQEHVTNVQSPYKHPPTERPPSNWSLAEVPRYKHQDHPIPSRSPRRLSPVRSPLLSPPAPPRMFEKSHPFLSKTFYGNPYL